MHGIVAKLNSFVKTETNFELTARMIGSLLYLHYFLLATLETGTLVPFDVIRLVWQSNSGNNLLNAAVARNFQLVGVVKHMAVVLVFV